jgi:transcription initiation factor TFIIIB Brf1 subunit/transcription initiation factor TFIIB
VTEVTIRNRFKELVEKLGLEEEVEKKVREDYTEREARLKLKTKKK